MKKTFLRNALYNQWANNRVLEYIEKLDISKLSINLPYGSFLDLVIHIFNAEHIWMNRINSTPVLTKILKELNFNSFMEIKSYGQTTDREFITMIRNFTDDYDFDAIIKYKNSKGTNFSNSVNEILTHVPIHSANHRAHLALTIRNRNLGKIPPIDAIYYFRNKLA